MTKYIIDYENSHWCGGQLFVVVNAKNEDEAQDLAEVHMTETQRELFSDEYEEDGEFEDESPYTVNSVEEFTPNHEYWRFYKDPSQSEFYPEIN